MTSSVQPRPNAALVAAGAHLPPGRSALQLAAAPALSVSAGSFKRADERASKLANMSILAGDVIF